MSEQPMTISDYKKAHEEIMKIAQAYQENIQFALACHENGIFTDKTREHVTIGMLLSLVLEKFQVYPLNENTTAENI